MEQQKKVDDMNFKEKAAFERQKLKQMNFSQRMEYIWEYYKMVFAGILVVIVLIGIVISSYKNMKKEDVLYISIADIYIDENNEDADFIEGYKEYIEFNEKKQIFTLDTSLSSNFEEESSYSYTSLMKMQALVAAGQLDIMIAPEAVTKAYGEQGMFKDIREVLTDELLERMEDYLLYTEDADTGEKIAYAVSLELSDTVMEGGYLHGDSITFAVSATSSNIENINHFLEYIL